MNDFADVPLIDTPFVDANGRITPAWFMLLVQLFRRTGGATGATSDNGSSLFDIFPASTLIDFIPSELWPELYAPIAHKADDMKDSCATGDSQVFTSTWDVVAPTPKPQLADVRNIAATGSPMTIYAPVACAIALNGPVTGVGFHRNGFGLVMPITSVLYELSEGDFLTLTYTIAPTITLIPR